MIEIVGPLKAAILNYIMIMYYIVNTPVHNLSDNRLLWSTDVVASVLLYT